MGQFLSERSHRSRAAPASLILFPFMPGWIFAGLASVVGHHLEPLRSSVGIANLAQDIPRYSGPS
jgi:hypothetical protein